MSGPVAEDGSPVELYARLPTFGEPELVHAALPEGAEILELGCGAGRMTHPLLRMGHPVTAVDSSSKMLAHLRGARAILARIEELELSARFDCVLLASHLVNVAEDDQRRGFVATCARHVRDSGQVLIQRYEPDWAADP
jgi:2-polyprenyl-3-methyl-5-hydroxy-6-metoxy-1,4-benzoquinol methylase